MKLVLLPILLAAFIASTADADCVVPVPSRNVAFKEFGIELQSGWGLNPVSLDSCAVDCYLQKECAFIIHDPKTRICRIMKFTTTPHVYPAGDMNLWLRANCQMVMKDRANMIRKLEAGQGTHVFYGKWMSYQVSRVADGVEVKIW
ncbi:unnamed protein product [Caenorhabditis sp. 36 PRJEB53466]|nr:unnamed protein product [Caenorhabditis sp. 36 PRJEB53466]